MSTTLIDLRNTIKMLMKLLFFLFSTQKNKKINLIKYYKKTFDELDAWVENSTRNKVNKTCLYVV